MSERILTFINKWFKHGSIIQIGWASFAKSEIEKLCEEAFNEGVLVGKQEKKECHLKGRMGQCAVGGSCFHNRNN